MSQKEIKLKETHGAFVGIKITKEFHDSIIQTRIY